MVYHIVAKAAVSLVSFSDFFLNMEDKTTVEINRLSLVRLHRDIQPLENKYSRRYRASQQKEIEEPHNKKTCSGAVDL